MGSNGFCPPKSGCFPAGLRVLVVDDDPTCLKILEKMLKKCNYEVTTCNLAQGALDMLREKKDGYDIVISDVNMPDMDGFKFLEHVGLKMDLPVIMMSVDGETSRVMRGVQHGACDYLLKPIRLKELRNIWQHVFRKRMHEVRGIEGQVSLDEIQKMRDGTEQCDDGRLFIGDVMISGNKRKELDDKINDREFGGDSSSVKKARVVWTVDLHQKFVKAVNRIGFDKVGPKKILDLMGVPWLTRENVASHLQKYRLYLSRLQKENELKAASGGGIKPLDISSNDVCLQNAVSHNSVTMQQNVVINENSVVHGDKIQIHNHDANICEGNVGGILSMPTGDVSDSPGFNQSFELLNSQVKSESKVQAHYTWTAGVPALQFKQEFKQHFQHTFDHSPLPLPPRVQADFVSHNPRPSSSEADKPAEANINRSYAIGTENAAALLSVQPPRYMTNCHAFDPVQCSMWTAKNHNLEENLSLKNIIVGNGSALRLREVEFNGYSSHGDFYPLNSHLVNLESFGYSNQELIADVRSDSENFDSECLSDPVDLVMNQGLYFS